MSEIAAELDMAPAQVSNNLKAVLTEVRVATEAEAETYREFELARLDKLLLALQDGIERGDPGSINAALKVSERRCKMLGLDSPIEMKLDDGGELRSKLLAMLG
ncbi:MAG: hypothetical protein EOM24_04180 [Chloroflexia bacterium]|nr:hypothetical protein [Chloroflexia bacterium]